MTTVREATFEFLRAEGMTTFFGNPGSTELPMLAEFPDDFGYVLGLQEAAAVGIADGYALAGGRPALVNLHTAPGVGNAMGAIFKARANKSPLVITAGQAGALADDARGAAHQPRRRADAAPPGQVELRAAAPPGRPARDRPGHAPGRTSAPRARVRVDPDGRLGRRGRGEHDALHAPAHRRRRGGARPRRDPYAGPPARGSEVTGPGRRRRHRRLRRLGR